MASRRPKSLAFARAKAERQARARTEANRIQSEVNVTRSVLGYYQITHTPKTTPGMFGIKTKPSGRNTTARDIDITATTNPTEGPSACPPIPSCDTALGPGDFSQG